MSILKYENPARVSPVASEDIMAERSTSLLEALLNMHREREPHAVLSTLLSTMTPEHGKAVICCYLLDRSDGEFRLEWIDDGSGDTVRTLTRADLRVPLVVQRGLSIEALEDLAQSGSPVHLTEQTPMVLSELWGQSFADSVLGMLGTRFTAVSPVSGAHGLAGVLFLFVSGAWPIDVAAECAAHAAVAIANVWERRAMTTVTERDQETGLLPRAAVEQAAAREINRAERYRRVLSVAVVTLPPNHTPEQLRGASALVTKVMRLPDTAGRLDAERLVVLLPEAPAGGAAAFLNRLRDGCPPELASIRFGTATWPQDGKSWQELVNVATSRNDLPDLKTLPGASVRGSLRAAFPTLKMPSDRPTRYGI